MNDLNSFESFESFEIVAIEVAIFLVNVGYALGLR